MIPPRFRMHLAGALACVLVAAAPAPAHAYRWEPVPPEQLAITAPRVEPGAGSEVLLWRVTIEDSFDGGLPTASQEHLVRVKLFDARGVDAHRTFKLPYSRDDRIDEVDVRTVLPDGRVLALARDEVFDRVVEKQGRRVEREVSFAPPGLEPGAIVEYHVRFHAVDRFSHFLPVSLQMREPVRRLELRVRPLQGPGFAMSYRTFHSPPVRFLGEGGGVYLAVLGDQRAFQEEPWMPDEDLVRPWLLLFYTVGASPAPERYWNDFAAGQHQAFMEATKPGRGVKQAAAEVVAGATDDDERIRRLFDWVRTRVRNLAADTTLTDTELAKRKPNASPEQTLERGLGTGGDVDRLFAAALRACGLDVRYAAVHRRTEGAADYTFTEPYFFRTWDVAVKRGDGWVLLDPSATWLPMGMLPWDEEGADAIVTGPDRALVTHAPISVPEASTRTSVADLTLDDEGALDGTVTVSLTGHLSAERRDTDRDRDPAERLARWKDELVAGVGALDVSAPAVSPPLPGAPTVYRATVHASGYAQRTGKRLFLQPSFFRRAQPPVFTASTRRHPIEFPYPWSEVDTVRIHLPEGFTPAGAPETPALVVPEVGRYETTVKMLEDGRTLLAVRRFRFGEDGHLRLPQSSYAALKQVFDTIRERDAATLTFAAPESR